MSDAFDRLERQLTAAVAAAGRPRRSGRWRRHAALSLAAGLVVAGGALAASGLLEVGDPLPVDGPPAEPHVEAGTVEGGTRILPLRVADPAGGPPWSLRVFGSSRGLSCVQLGRVYEGRFGMLAPPRLNSTRLVFRELQPVPGQNSLCGGVERQGFPVIRGLRSVQLDGGSGNPLRCRVGGKLEACPIRHVRIIRYGLLGPSAVSARYVDPAAGVERSMPIEPLTGGAYLFVVAADPAPARRGEQAQQRIERLYGQVVARARRDGVPSERVMRLMERALRRHPELRHSLGGPPVTDGVVATFTGGRRLRVAGHGRTQAALPGVARHTGPPPRPGHAALDVSRTGGGSRLELTVRFRAPVRIDRADRHYALTVSGLTGSLCDHRISGGGLATVRDIAAGETVRFRVTPAMTGRSSWCPGRHRVTVGYQTPGTPFRGVPIGHYAFRVGR